MSQHRSTGLPRTVREVVFADGVRTPFGRAGDNGIYAGTRAEDLMVNQLARQFEEDPDVRSGITTLCIGLGMGATVIWENPHHATYSGNHPAAHPEGAAA